MVVGRGMDELGCLGDRRKAIGGSAIGSSGEKIQASSRRSGARAGQTGLDKAGFGHRAELSKSHS